MDATKYRLFLIGLIIWIYFVYELGMALSPLAISNEQYIRCKQSLLK